MHRPVLTFALVLSTATMALSHAGVKNETVKARMQMMSKIGAATKTLGTMAAGKTAYDQAIVDATQEELAKEADSIIAFFKENADDPKSEARAEIWNNFPDFEKKAEALSLAAGEVSSVRSAADLKLAMRAIGASCKGCHQAYRE